MYRIERLKKMIENQKESNQYYQKLLSKNPDSLIDRGMVKNGKERLRELEADMEELLQPQE